MSFFSFSLLIFVFLPVERSSKQLEFQPKHIAIAMEYGGRSHIKNILEISNTLAQRGHKVSYFSTDEDLRFADGYNVSKYSIGAPLTPHSARSSKFVEALEGKNNDVMKYMSQLFIEIAIKSYIDTFPKFVELIKDHKPDAIICDFGAAACIDAAHRESVPLIIGFQTIDAIKIASAPYITKKFDFSPLTFNDMTFWQKFYYTIIDPVYDPHPFNSMGAKLNEARAQYGNPPSENIFGDINNVLVFINTFFGFEVARPLPPNLKLIGPVMTLTPTPLTEDLNSFLNAHRKTLYIAFGSHVSMNKFDIKQVMSAALLALEQNVIDGIIWGLGSTQPTKFLQQLDFNGKSVNSKSLLVNQHPDIRVLPWAPQQTILSHDNVKLFISHGGLESSFEGLYTGTPLLVYAFLGDQPRNGRKIKESGVGDFIDRVNTNSKEIFQKMKYIIEDKEGVIGINVKRLQILAQIGSRRREDAANSIEEYIYTVEVCRKLKDIQALVSNTIPCEIRHLIPASSQMSFIEANSLDVYAVAALIVFFSIAGLVYFTPKLARKITKRRIQKTKIQ